MSKLWLNLIRKVMKTMKHILLASHGTLASGLKNTLQIFMGPSNNIKAVCAYVDDSSDYLEDIKVFIKEHDNDDSIIFVDIYGGSVCQQVVKIMMDEGKSIPIVAQMNLPIVLSLALEEDDHSLKHIIELCAQAAPQVVANEAPKEEDEDE